MKGVATEVILTVGVLVAAGFTLFQLRGIYLAQQELGKEEVVEAFAKDLESIVDKAIATTGDAAFVYYPTIKKYKVEIKDNVFSIFDKISGKTSTFSKLMPEIVDNSFEDCEKIFVVKKNEKIILMCRCLELGEDCQDSLLCCSGYCNQTSGKCEELPICPQERICPNAPESTKDNIGQDCCPFDRPVCTSGHCCPNDKPIWCENPVNGNPRCMDQAEFNTFCTQMCNDRRSQEGCRLVSSFFLPPYNTCPSSPHDEVGVYCSGKVKEIVDSCMSFDSQLDRVKCIVRWSYNHFDGIVYDHSSTCWCVGRRGLNPNDIISCAQTKVFPSGCKGCGQCIDFATTLYSLLMTCGQDCGITTHNLYLVSGCLASHGKCVGCHEWLLYKHPSAGWVFIDPTITQLMGAVDQYFASITSYPCITFSIENLDSTCTWSTPDSLVASNMCPGWGIDLSTCPT